MPKTTLRERRSLARDLKVLVHDRGLTVTEAARQLGLPRSSAYRLLRDPEANR